jgi:peptide/nickel transport system permease protein
VSWVRVIGAFGRIAVAVAGVAAVAWLLAEAAPGSSAERAARAAGVLPPDDSPVPAALRRDLLARVAERHGLDRPVAVRVAVRVGALVRLDFGRSWVDDAPVRDRLVRAAAPTLWLVALALLLGLSFGLIAGALAASRPRGALDLALAAAAALALAVPPVWLAMVGLRALAAGHPFALLPPGGWGSAAAAVLPVFTLALVPAFVIARHARAALVEAAATPWALATRARGVSRARLVWKHGLRVAAPVLAPLLPVLVAYLLGAVLVIERVFGIHGLGDLLVAAAARGDAPTVVGVAVVAGALVAVASAVADGIRVLADPRQRREVDGGA